MTFGIDPVNKDKLKTITIEISKEGVKIHPKLKIKSQNLCQWRCFDCQPWTDFTFFKVYLLLTLIMLLSNKVLRYRHVALETARKLNIHKSYEHSVYALWLGMLLYENTNWRFWEKSGLQYSDSTSRKRSMSWKWVEWNPW